MLGTMFWAIKAAARIRCGEGERGLVAMSGNVGTPASFYRKSPVMDDYPARFFSLY